MKILIIGGTGTISTPLTRYLIERGEEITLYNRGLTQPEAPAETRHIRGDRTNFAAFEAQMKEAGDFDYVIDMICFLSEEAESAVRAFKGRTGHYIFCSTVDVYTKPAKFYPITEDHQRNPFSSFPYAFEKAKCENIFFEAYHRGDFLLSIIRPGATYREGGGPVHPFRGGTYNLDRLRRGKPIILHGDGNSIWSACHSEDVARAFVGAIGNTKTYGNAYHVTGEEWMTWNYYWQSTAEVMGVSPPVIVHIPTDLLQRIAPRLSSWCVENFQHNNIFDNTAARNDLGFRYTITWKEGVRRSLKWLDEHGGLENSGNYPFYDRIIQAWEKLGERMAQELKDIDRGI